MQAFRYNSEVRYNGFRRTLILNLFKDILAVEVYSGKDTLHKKLGLA